MLRIPVVHANRKCNGFSAFTLNYVLRQASILYDRARSSARVFCAALSLTNRHMKRFQYLLILALTCGFMGGVAHAQSQKAPATKAADKKLTCCEQAFKEAKECRNKCCITAHRQEKSCEKCNPGKQDLEILKKLKAKEKENALKKS
jgi:hypothetical protein